MSGRAWDPQLLPSDSGEAKEVSFLFEKSLSGLAHSPFLSNYERIANFLDFYRVKWNFSQHFI